MSDVPAAGYNAHVRHGRIIGPIVNVIASIEAAEALKILSGHREAISRRLTIIDLWDNQVRAVDLARLARQHCDCRVCKHNEFAWLSGERGDTSAVLCGRNSVQLKRGKTGTTASLDEIATRLKGVGNVQRNSFLCGLTVDDYVLTVFPDGRTIVAAPMMSQSHVRCMHGMSVRDSS